MTIRALNVKNLIIPGNFAAIALPIAKEYSVEMCVSGTVAEPTIKVFGRPKRIEQAICALAK